MSLPVPVPELRRALKANRWRLGDLCVERRWSLVDVKEGLARTAAGRKLLADYEAKKRTSGPSGAHKHPRRTIAGIPSEEYEAQVKHAAREDIPGRKGMSWGEWMRHAAREQMRRERGTAQQEKKR